MRRIGPAASEKKSFENVDDGRRTDDGRTDGRRIPLYTKSSGELIISKVSIIVTFSHIKAEFAKFDLAVKYVKINTGLSFEQNIMSLNL